MFIKRSNLNHDILLALMCGLAVATPRSAQDSAFTYQGQLVGNGLPHSGPVEMQFTLFNVATGGTAIAANMPPISSIDVNNGLFIVALDFGAAAFPGEERWLEIQVRVAPDAFPP